MKHFKNIRNFGWTVLPQTRPNSFHGVTEPFGLSVMQPFRKHSSWWLGRAPQHPLSRPSSFHGGKHGYRFNVMQTFNNVQMNGWSCCPKHGPAQFMLLSQILVRMAWSFSKPIQNLGWVVLSQTQPSSFHGVEKPFRLDIMQPFRKHSSWWLGWASQYRLSRPSLLRVVKLCFRFDVMQTINSVKWTAGRAFPNTVQFKSRWWVNFSSGWREAFQKHSKVRLGRAPPNTAQFLSRCWGTFSSGYYAATSKTFKLMVGPRSPTFSITAQLISRRRRFFSFWCYADAQQRSNERLVVLPQTRSSSIHGVEST